MLNKITHCAKHVSTNIERPYQLHWYEWEMRIQGFIQGFKLGDEKT